jgi:tetratricopeptide (TPR) repeat protein
LPQSGWTKTTNQHFEIFSQAGEQAGRQALAEFEQLRTFFQHLGLQPDDRSPVRVIGFRSPADYDAYRLRPAADAYFAGTENRNYIVMPNLGSADFGIAAHEYTHLVLHANGLKFPAWLSEGLAEFFSSVRINDRQCVLGDPLRNRIQVLERNNWLPFADLLRVGNDSPLRDDRKGASLFYSESWGLVHMLILSPAYGPRFASLRAAAAAGELDEQSLSHIYDRPSDQILRDLHLWVEERQPRLITLPGITAEQISGESRLLSTHESRFLLGELLLATRQPDRAESILRELAKEEPGNPEVAAALGTARLARGDATGARQYWLEAIQKGIKDPALCLRYAQLASDAGLPADQVRPALERAVFLKPDFDDARYTLALLENTAGNAEAAVQQFRAIQHVPPGRAYAYWSAFASALLESGRREEATEAATRAKASATTSTERSLAAQLIYITKTDLTVQVTHTPDGQIQMVTTRVPHGTTDWNPFIEPNDKIVRVQGQLRAVQCGPNRVTGMTVDTTAGSLTLLIPDPTKVQIKNSPGEFNCGPQTGAQKVTAEYAASASNDAHAAGVLRGMQFQ